VPQRPSDKQMEFVAALLLAVQKTKKPVVLVSTKQDEADDQQLKELERLMARRELKGTVPLVETSAHENVNIEAAFLLLANLIDKNKPRFKIHPYVEAARMRREVCQVSDRCVYVFIYTPVSLSTAERLLAVDVA
jgi:50S ribosomal subunit-associated GTPase HflX